MTSPFARMAGGMDVPLHFPEPRHISLRDVAHHLALANRYGGATALPYSVAQHSVLVSDLIWRRHKDHALAFEGLIHDAHEAYLGDIATPVERALFGDAPLTPLTQAKARLDLVIRTRFGLPPLLAGPAMASVQAADRLAAATEWRCLMPGPAPAGWPDPAPVMIRPLPWDRAEELFLKTFHKLAAACGLPFPA